MSYRLNRNIVLIFIFLFFASACSEKIWQKDSSAFFGELRDADYTWLLGLDFSKLNPSEVAEFGAGAALMTGRIFESHDKPDQARIFYALEWSRTTKLTEEDRFWAQKAGKALYPLYLEMEQKLAAESFLKEYLYVFPEDADAALSLGLLYLEEKKLAEGAKVLSGISESQVPQKTAEFRYAKFLKAYLENKPHWRTDLADLVLNTRTNSFFKDLSLKLGPIPELVGSNEMKAVAFKEMIFAGKYNEAYLIYKTFDWNKIAVTSELVRDLALMYRYASKISEGLDVLNRFLGNTKDPALRLRLNQRIGWLTYAAGSYASASNWFLSAYDAEPAGADADWALWYYWQSLYHENAQSFVARAFAKKFSVADKSYFSDIWDEVIIDYLGKKDFVSLKGFYLKAKSYMNDSDLIRVIQILESARIEGLFKEPFDAQVETSAVNLANVPWYHELLVYRLKGESANLFSSDGGAVQKKTDLSLEEKYIEACLLFGLYKDASKAQNELVPQDPNFTRYVMDELLKDKRYYPAIMFSGPLGFGKMESLSKKDLKTLYPIAYKDLIDKEAKNQGIPPWFLMALVRQESAFGYDAESGAGATGLAQFMPETAAEVATELKMESYDLAKPEDSLKMGAYYIRRMIQKNDFPYLGLMAYNAGPTRLKEWKLGFEGLPALVQIEMVPFLETRSYVKRIYVGCLVYGTLWYGKTEAEIQSWFFSIYQKQ